MRLAPTQRTAGLAGLAGGLLWALTPLRQPVFGAGRTPEEGELFFRGYNLVLVIVALLLTAALLGLRGTARAATRSWTIGWWTTMVGHALIAAGSLPAVVLGGAARSVVMSGQDVGFLGAVVAAVGALLLGLNGLRRRNLPKAPSWLFLLTLPLGLPAIVLLTVVGVPEDYLGLPLTVLYGGGWAVLGLSWLRTR